MPTIKLTTPDGAKMQLDLPEGTVTFGRVEGNDLVIPDGSVSSRHGEIHVKGDSIELVDLGSTNGTHVDGKRVERATVAPGGTFKLGSVEGVLVGTTSAAPEVSSAPAEEPAPEPAEEEAPAAPRVSMPRPSPGGAPAASSVVVSGLGSTPCPTGRRKGFGPKVKEKDKVASLFVAIGVLSLLVCAGAAFLIFKMGA